MKMNQEIKVEWLRRLRSGDYDQGRRRLRRGDKYCCLGVLGDIAVDEGVVEWKLNEVDESGRYGMGSLVRTGTLPVEVYEWAGLPSGNPKVDDVVLSDWNDTYEYSFDQIADLIERHL